MNNKQGHLIHATENFFPEKSTHKLYTHSEEGKKNCSIVLIWKRINVIKKTFLIQHYFY